MQKEKSDLRIFGLIWVMIFSGIALYPLINEEEVIYWSLYVAAFFAVSAITYPEIYKIIRFYQVWIKFGDLAGKFNSKIIIFALFYFLFLPISVLLKIFRKDLLGKKINSKAKSYFIDRQQQPKDMENQF